MDSGLLVLDSGFFVSGPWIPDSNRQRDSGFLEPYSRIQSRIPKAKISRVLESLPWAETTWAKQSPICRNPSITDSFLRRDEELNIFSIE